MLHRSIPLAVLFFGVVALVGGGATFLACQTSSETPNAFFGRDGGPGSLNAPCRSTGECNDVSLVCTTDALGSFCRAACTPDNAQACGAGFDCVRLVIADGGTVDGGPDHVCDPTAAGEGEGEGAGEGEGEGAGEGEGEGGGQ